MGLIWRYLAERTNMNTATNQGSRWMFPGRPAAQPCPPLRPAHEGTGPDDRGQGRGAALRRHLLESPAPVVADAFGYHRKTAAILADEAGNTWSGYAPGDHSPSQPTVHG